MDEENTLIWSCDKIKFLKIVSENDYYTFTERLLNIFDSEWYLEVKADHESKAAKEKLENYNYFTKWTFYLQRKKVRVTKCVRVEFTLISRAKVIGKDAVEFGEREGTRFVHEYVFKSSDYDLNLSLLFVASKKTDKDPIFISKLSNLSEDMKSLLECERMTDVVLKCGSVVVRAHKNILSARSAVFAAMFTNPLQKNSENPIVIKDVDPSVFRVMIEFLYSGKVRFPESMACQLGIAAENYEIEALRDELNSVVEE